MLKRFGFAAVMLLLVPTLSCAGIITSYVASNSTGSISFSGVANYSAVKTFTFTANSGYTLDKVTLKIGNTTALPVTPTPDPVVPKKWSYTVGYTPSTQTLVVYFKTDVVSLIALTANLGLSPKSIPANTPLLITGSGSSIFPSGTTVAYTFTAPGATLDSPTGTATSGSAVRTNFTAPVAGLYNVTLLLKAGSVTSTATAQVNVISSQAQESNFCLSCHTGGVPAAGYLGSLHATASGAPSCPTCHNPGLVLSHPGKPVATLGTVCSTCHYQGSFPGNLSFHNDFFPDPGNICLTCHDPHALLPINLAGLPKPHFSTITSASDPNYVAMYVTPRTSCSYCHGTPLRFQNNTTTAAQARTDWAKSGKGDVTALPWKNSVTHDWKSSGTANATPATTVATDCVRCHVTKGFTQYVGSGYTNISPVGSSSDKSSEPLTCNGCHNTDRAVNPGFSIRSSSYVTAYYNYSSVTTKKLIVKANKFFGYKPFYSPPTPTTNGGSNLCISCHTGRQSGETLLAANKAGLNFNNASFINSHYMSAAGTLYQSTGFRFYTSTVRNKYLISGGGLWHQYIGTNPGAGLPGGVNGPCVGCHMASDPASTPRHSFNSVTKESSVLSFCNNLSCHGGAMDSDFPTLTSGYFNDSLAALKYLLQTKKGIYYTDVYPYFYDVNGAQFKAWGNVKTMGAAFNYNLLIREKGAWAHNPDYVHRLIWDSIDYLDDGVMNNSTPAAIAAMSGQPFAAGASFYLDGFRK